MTRGEFKELVENLHKEKGGTLPLSFFGASQYLDKHLGREKTLEIFESLKEDNQDIFTLCSIGVCIENLQM
jgi:hypothetical protein